MNIDVILVLAVVLVDLALFVHGRLRMDLIALLTLAFLAITGLVTPTEALAGFSNPAVVTVWAVFVLSGGLARTGIASMVGRQVTRIAGHREIPLVLVIMLTAGTASAFMNNVGVAAILLPVVMDLSREAGIPPSRLLLPLAYACLLGGLTTLIGTPPNLLVADALRSEGLEPFGLFDYSPVGLVVVLAGFAFLVLAVPVLVPKRSIRAAVPDGDGGRLLPDIYGFNERFVVLRLPQDSPLAGKSLGEIRLGSVAGLQAIMVIRDGRPRPLPGPGFLLRPRDRIVVQGPVDRLGQLRGSSALEVDDGKLDARVLDSPDLEIAEVGVPEGSELIGHSLGDLGFADRYGVRVMTIRREGAALAVPLQGVALQAADTLVVRGPPDRVEDLAASAELTVEPADQVSLYGLRDELFAVRVPGDSFLVGQTLRECRLGDALGLWVMTVLRDGRTIEMPPPDERLQAGDLLVVRGRSEEISTLEGIRDLEVEEEGFEVQPVLETERLGIAEVVLSPHTALGGQTLRQLGFRRKYGLMVLAIWRAGKPYRAGLRDLPLRSGDALLVHGPRKNLRLLASDPDFLVLTEAVQVPPRRRKAPIAAGLLALTLAPVLLGWLPISIAAVAGGALMILTGCLTMEEAYRSIEWQAVFLIAGMLPLGIALEEAGVSALLAEAVVASVGDFGPRAAMAAFFLVTSLATQVMPNAAVVVLMSPIVLGAAAGLGVSPYPLMMAVAIAASASFASPVSHPANVLVMGPGGYRFTDYLRVGLPLTAVVFVVVMIVMPLVWTF
ncbi:MAG: SLC13 family permease [Gammaproteobacteria bacterium]|nr:SLC13 family permease [Gammaproteobacteria bacterium]